MSLNKTEFDLFVSYSHEDDEDGWISAFVAEIMRLYREIAVGELRVFFDKSTIVYLQDWEHHILQGLKESKVMLAFVSRSYFEVAVHDLWP